MEPCDYYDDTDDYGTDDYDYDVSDPYDIEYDVP